MAKLLAAAIFLTDFVLALLAASPGWAITITWDANGASPPNGTFSVATNWNPDQVPLAGDTAVFNLASTYTVTFTANAASDVLQVTGGTVNFRSNSATVRTYNLTTGGADLQVNGGTLNIGSASLPVVINVGDTLFVGTSTGNGTVLVDGASSALNVSGSGHNLGLSGFAGTLTYANGAQGSIAGTLNVGVSGVSTTTGNLNVQSDADLTLGNLNIGTFTSSTATGTVTVTGSGSTIVQSGASTLTIGSASANIGSLHVTSNGVFSTGTGTVTVNATGSINIGAGFTGGTLNANGNVNVNGGSITRTSGSFNLASGRTLTASNNAQINLGGSTALSGGTTWLIQTGADLFTAGFLDIGTSGGVTTVTIDGAGSSLAGSEFGSFWGDNGHTAQVTVRNGAAANVGAIELARSSTAGTTGTISVESGATMTAGHLLVAIAGGGTTTGTITVTGTGSTLTQTGASTLTLGHSTTGTATLNVLNGGTFTAGSGGTILRQTGTINIDGGFANLGPLDLQGGVINFLAGSLSYGGNLTVGAGGLLGTDLTLPATKHLAPTGTTTVKPLRTLTLDGGKLTTSQLLVESGGIVHFNSGTLAITGAGGLTIGSGGPLGDRVTLGSGQTIQVANTATVDSAAILVLQSGGAMQAGTLSNQGTVVLDGLTALLGGGAVNNSGLLRGEGTVTAAVTNQAGGELRAQTGKTLALAGVNGPNAGKINLQGGTIDFAQALTNAAGGRITGRGTLMTGGLTNQGHVALSSGITDVFGDVVNNTGSGSIGITVSGNADATFWDDVTNTSGLFRVSANSSATFFGSFGGAGISGPGDVYFEADITPGFSPAAVNFGGNVFLGPSARLEIELGGTAPGTQYDQVQVAGALSVDGTLDLELINSFVPQKTDTFQIMTYGSRSGLFPNVEGFEIGPNQTFSLHYNDSRLLAIAGEWNGGGPLAGLLQAPGELDITGAASLNGTLTIFGGGVVNVDTQIAAAAGSLLRIGGATTTSAAVAAVPEPSAWALMLVAATLLLAAGQRAVDGRIPVGPAS